MSRVGQLLLGRRTCTTGWDDIILGKWNDSQRLQNFRMRKQTFPELWKELAPTGQWQNTHFRRPIPVQKRVAIARQLLVSCKPLQDVEVYGWVQDDVSL